MTVTSVLDNIVKVNKKRELLCMHDQFNSIQYCADQGLVYTCVHD